MLFGTGEEVCFLSPFVTVPLMTETLANFETCVQGSKRRCGASFHKLLVTIYAKAMP